MSSLTGVEHSPEIETWSALKAWFYSFTRRDPPSNHAVVERADLKPDDRVLDIGCGPGAALALAAASGAEVCGVDPSPAMVKRASRRVPRATVVAGSAESLPFPDHHFTVAWAISTFHHWAATSVALEESRRVLAPGGRLMIAERRLEGRGGGGHGLTAEGAESVGEQLRSHGYRVATTDSLNAGGIDYLLVTGIV